MKRKTILWLGLGILLFGAGCGQGNQASGPRVFGVSFQTMNNPFFVDLDEGLRSVIEARGDQLITLDAQFNSLKQKNDVSDLVLQGVSMIFINPVNWTGVKGSLLQAQDKGIGCIVVDAPVMDQGLVLSMIVSDNMEAGRMAARALVEARRPAKIGVFELSLNKACTDRIAGFLQVLAEYPDMQIVNSQEVKGTTESGRTVMLDMIGRHPEINALFAINDPSALGAISALESVNKLADMKVVSMDGSPEAIQAILEGKLLSTSAQYPREIGIEAANVAYAHLEGRPYRQEIKVRVELINQENAKSHLNPVP